MQRKWQSKQDCDHHNWFARNAAGLHIRPGADRDPAHAIRIIAYRPASAHLSHPSHRKVCCFFRALLCPFHTAGTVPSCLATSFPGLTSLDLSVNALSGSLPPSLAGLVNLTTLKVQDNLFNGTLPAAFATPACAGLTVTLAYNPLLVGTVPATLALGSVLQPSGSCYYFAMGTSLGLDRPMASILSDISAAVDPSGQALGTTAHPSTGWVLQTLGGSQPCVPYYSQPTSSAAYGGSNLLATRFNAGVHSQINRTHVKTLSIPVHVCRCVF